jgi:hypothetical protein
MTTVMRKAKVPDQLLETVPKLLCSSQLVSRRLVPRLRILYVITLLLAWKSNAQDLHYTLEISGKRGKTQRQTRCLVHQSL